MALGDLFSRVLYWVFSKGGWPLSSGAPITTWYLGQWVQDVFLYTWFSCLGKENTCYTSCFYLEIITSGNYLEVTPKWNSVLVVNAWALESNVYSHMLYTFIPWTVLNFSFCLFIYTKGIISRTHVGVERRDCQCMCDIVHILQVCHRPSWAVFPNRSRLKWVKLTAEVIKLWNHSVLLLNSHNVLYRVVFLLFWEITVQVEVVKRSQAFWCPAKLWCLKTLQTPLFTKFWCTVLGCS